MHPKPVNQSHSAITGGKNSVRINKKAKGPSTSSTLEKHPEKMSHQRRSDVGGMISVMQQANHAAKAAIQQKQGQPTAAARLHTAHPGSHPQQRALTSSGAGISLQPASTSATTKGLNPRQQLQHAKKALTVQQQITLE